MLHSEVFFIIYVIYIRGIQHGEHARLFLFALINVLLGVPR